MHAKQPTLNELGAQTKPNRDIMVVQHAGNSMQICERRPKTPPLGPIASESLHCYVSSVFFTLCSAALSMRRPVSQPGVNT